MFVCLFTFFLLNAKAFKGYQRKHITVYNEYNQENKKHGKLHTFTTETASCRGVINTI